MPKHETSQFALHPDFHLHRFRHFEVKTLEVRSQALKDNPLGDPSDRLHPLLVPRAPAPAGGWPVVFVLAGFTGNGPNYFNLKTFEPNLPEVLDRCRDKGEAPDAVYVFCEAMTSWGGSQFINSAGMGRYEDHVAGEVREAVLEQLPVSRDPALWCVAGGSSGGYGALQLASRFPDRFAVVAAIAADSFFEASLLPEIYAALPSLEKLGGLRGVRAELDAGRFLKKREAHAVLNVIAMGLCYAGDGRGDFELPVQAETGVLLPEVWRRWKAHDPVSFLAERGDQVRRLSGIYLDAGRRDQYHLQYGTRQIRDVLRRLGGKVEHQEFDGTHFDLGERRPAMWKWLKDFWRS